MKLTALILLLGALAAAASSFIVGWSLPADTNGIVGYQFQSINGAVIYGYCGGAGSTNSPLVAPYGAVIVAVSVYADGVSTNSNAITNDVTSSPFNFLRKK